MTALAVATAGIRPAAPHRLTARSGMLSCAAAMAILGGSVPVTKTLAAYPHMAGQAMRYGIAAAVLIPLAARIRHRCPPTRITDWARLALIAAVGLVAFNLCLLTALQHGDAAVAATILGCAPIALGIATPLLARQAPSLRILAAAAFITVATVLLNGSGHMNAWGIVTAVVALAADVVFTVLAAPLLRRLGPITVAAATCGLAVPMFAALAICTGEISRWRTPDASEAAAIVFLGLILTAVSFLLWFNGLRYIGSAKAGITIGVIPVAALAATSIQAATVPSVQQAIAIAAVTGSLAVGTTTKTWHLAPPWPRIRLAAVGLVVATLAVAGCTRGPAPTPSPQDPAEPVRAYFAALARGDTATAYQLSRSASRWLSGDGLAHGYQPPTNVQIIATTVAAQGNGNLVYVRAQYKLGETVHESSFEVWKSSGHSPQWTIGSGATGRLDVISATSPHIMIANVHVATPLNTPRVSGGIPSAGYFDVPPGVYTVRVVPTTPQPTEPATIAVPAMWRDGTPVTITIRGTFDRAASAPPAPHAPSRGPPGRPARYGGSTRSSVGRSAISRRAKAVLIGAVHRFIVVEPVRFAVREAARSLVFAGGGPMGQAGRCSPCQLDAIAPRTRLQPATAQTHANHSPVPYVTAPGAGATGLACAVNGRGPAHASAAARILAAFSVLNGLGGRNGLVSANASALAIRSSRYWRRKDQRY